MTQKEFAKRFKIYMGSKKTLIQAEKDVKGFVETLKEVLKDEEDGKITLPGFGVFTVKTRKEKRLIHPKTKEPIIVPARKKVTFKTSPLLESIVN